MPASPPRFLPTLVVLYMIAAFGVTDLYLPSLPTITAEFGSTPLMGQASFTLFLAGFALANFLFGPLSDRYGRRPVLLAGGAGFVAATLLCALAPSMGALIAGRILQGAVLASVTVCTQAMVRELYDDRDVVRIIAFIAMIEALAPALAPVVGAEIALAFGWRANFWFVGGAVVVVLAGFALFAPESLPRESRASLDPRAVGQTYVRLFSRRALMAPLVSAGLVFAGLMVYLTSAPFYFIDELGVGERGFAVAQFGTVLFYIAGLVLTPRLAARLGATPVIAGGFIATAIGGLGMMATALILPVGVLAFVAPFAIFAFGIGLAMAPLITEALSADRSATGAVAAVIGVVTIGCAFAGSLLAGVAYDGSQFSIAWPLALTAVLAVAIFQSRPRDVAARVAV